MEIKFIVVCKFGIEMKNEFIFLGVYLFELDRS